MEEEFRALLTGSAAVTALVPAPRINWEEHPQGAGWPGVVINLIGSAEGLTQQGPDGLHQGRVQVDCNALTFKESRDIARVIQTVLHGHADGGFRLVRHVATRHSREGGTNEAERVFRVSMDFTTAWRAT